MAILTSPGNMPCARRRRPRVPARRNRSGKRTCSSLKCRAPKASPTRRYFSVKRPWPRFSANAAILSASDRRFDSDFLRDKVAAYRRVADWLLESGRIDEGLAVLQLMKTEELSDFGVRGAVAPMERGVDFTRGELEFRDRYSRVVGAVAGGADDIARLSTLEERDRISAMERDYLHGLLAGQDAAERDRVQRIEAMLNNGAEAGGETAEHRIIDAPALAGIAQRFGSDTAFAVYLLAENHVRVLVNARGHQAEFRTGVDAPALQRDIGHFLDDIVQRRDSTALSEKLYTAAGAAC